MIFLLFFFVRLENEDFPVVDSIFSPFLLNHNNRMSADYNGMMSMKRGWPKVYYAQFWDLQSLKFWTLA